MFEFLLALPLLILFVFFAAIFFLGMLMLYTMRVFSKKIDLQNRGYKNPYTGKYEEIIDLKDQKKNKIILAISIIIILCILILANFIKIDSSGKIYFPEKQKKPSIDSI